jgi:hypothetical protein
MFAAGVGQSGDFVASRRHKSVVPVGLRADVAAGAPRRTVAAGP